MEFSSIDLPDFLNRKLKKEYRMPVVAKIEHPIPGKQLPDLTKTISDGTNRPDQIETLFAIGQIEVKQKAIDDAKKAMKELRNALVLRGHSLKALDVNMKAREKEDKTTEDEMREIVRVARFMGLPYGFQINFLDEPTATTAGGADVAKIARDDGFNLGITGKDPDDQKWPPMTPEGQEHRKGWNEGQEVLKSKFRDLQDGMTVAEKEAAKVKAEKEKKKADRAAKAVSKGKKALAEAEDVKDALADEAVH